MPRLSADCMYSTYMSICRVVLSSYVYVSRETKQAQESNGKCHEKAGTLVCYARDR